MSVFRWMLWRRLGKNSRFEVVPKEQRSNKGVAPGRGEAHRTALGHGRSFGRARTKCGKDWSAGDEFAILSRRRHISRDMPASRGFSVVRAFPVWRGPRMQGAVRRGCTYGGERFLFPANGKTLVEPRSVRFTLGSRCGALKERFPPVPLVHSFLWAGVTFATDRFNVLNLLFGVVGKERQWFVSSPERHGQCLREESEM
ncbi:hypothetical protein TNCV_215851 [Trichonephila clavipes]|nr:hypothetical protein TNCV_215851 [Trichonephila clavipes]